MDIRSIAAAAVLVGCVQGAAAQAFLEQPCIFTAITFDFSKNESYRSAQTFSGQGCTTSFRGGLRTSFESLSVVQRARHLAITPASNGFGFTVARRTAGYAGADSYTLKVCGQSAGGRGCATITYDVTIR
jgi:hypothetical protein